MSILDDIHDVLGGERYETYIAVRCPFHGDNHPSMMIYEDWYRCLACGVNGPTERLAKQLTSGKISVLYSYGSDNTSNFPNPFRSWLKRSPLVNVLRGAWEFANHNPQQITYITEKRGIPEKTRRSIGIGYREQFFTFPVTDQNSKVVGAFIRAGAGLNTSRYYVPNNQSPNLLYAPSWKRVQNSKTIFILFGPLDAISLHVLGFASISTLSGKNLDVTTLNSIRKRIVFIPDYGEEREAHRIAARLGWRGSVYHFPYPDNCKDINDVYCQNTDLITNALEEFSYADQLDGCIRDRSGQTH